MLGSASVRRPVGQSSPGLLGYALAISLSFLALVVEIGFLSYLDGDTYWTPVNTAVFVLFLGAVPAAVIGAVGAAFVHVATRRASSQWPAILLAGLIGLVVGLIFFPEDLLLAGLLALDAAGGRLAVVPLAHRRSRNPH